MRRLCITVSGFMFALLLAAPAGSTAQQSSPAQQQPQAQPQQPPAANPSPANPTDSTQQPPQAASQSPTTNDDGTVKGVKAGSEKDVNSIGNRNVGTGVNLFSLQREIAMGKEAAMEVEKTAKMINDPVVTEYVNRVGQNLVRNSDAKVPFTIKVIDSDEINAFALPGGFFYVNSGLILRADEEAELAGVMGHEIAHVAARHATKTATKGQIMEWASIPLILLGPGGWAGYGLYEGLNFALPMSYLKFTRDAEREADFLGLQYMYKSGYDPNAFIAFFEKVQAQEKKKPGTLSKAFSTHPQTPDRIAKSQDEIERILPARAQYVVTTSEFDDVKSRLAALENRHKVLDQKDTNKPSLRRTSNTSKTGNGKGDDSGDDRPTLKRREDQNQD